jgi:hypothetical protein
MQATLLQPKSIALLIKSRQKVKSPHCGYGACSSSGCNCKQYEGNANTCGNCGHSYDRHW